MPIATITSKGQVTIPIEIRNRLELKEGHVLKFEINENNTVTMYKDTNDQYPSQVDIIADLLLLKKRILVIGPPGCGKSYLVHDVKRKLGKKTEKIEIFDNDEDFEQIGQDFRKFLKSTTGAIAMTHSVVDFMEEANIDDVKFGTEIDYFIEFDRNKGIGQFTIKSS